MSLIPEFKKHQRVWYYDESGIKHRVFIAEVWWGGKHGSKDFFIPKFHKGQKVFLKWALDVPITIDSVYNFKQSWECDRSDFEHGGYIEHYKETRYYCSGWITGTFYESELEPVDDTKPTEKDICYEIYFNGMYRIVSQMYLE